MGVGSPQNDPSGPPQKDPLGPPQKDPSGPPQKDPRLPGGPRSHYPVFVMQSVAGGMYWVSHGSMSWGVKRKMAV